MDKQLLPFGTKVLIVRGYHKDQKGIVVSAEGHNSGFSNYWYEYEIKLSKTKTLHKYGEDSIILI